MIDLWWISVQTGLKTSFVPPLGFQDCEVRKRVILVFTLGRYMLATKCHPRKLVSQVLFFYMQNIIKTEQLVTCVWVNNSSCWAEGGVPGRNRTRGCRTAAQRTNHWAALLPSELRCTLLSCAAPYWAALHPPELRCTLLSCAAPSWAALHPTELRCTLLSCAAPSTELRCTLILTSQQGFATFLFINARRYLSS